VSDEGLFSHTVAELSALLASRQITAVALAELALSRLERIGSALNAVATLTRERALAEARHADAELAAGRNRGPLHGIPYGAKDLLDTGGIATRWGANPYRDRVPASDADVIVRLKDAGAVLVAKLAMIELAGGLGYNTAAASITGPARNPWNRGRWTCGSSSGSGAAVAARLVPFAIGSETWGSILCPASFCGVTGLRPTYDRVSRRGAMALSWTMDKLGPLATTARDCATVLSVISERPLAAASIDVATLRIGALDLDFSKFGQKEVEQRFKEALDVLRGAGLSVAAAMLPDLPFEEVAGLTIQAEAVTAFEELDRNGRVGELSDPDAVLSFELAREIRASDYLKGMRLRTRMREEMDRFFGQWDLIVAPTERYVASRLDQKLDEALAGPDTLGGAGNLLGLPAISVPCGFGADNLPVGLSIVGAPWREDQVVALAEFFQAKTDWHRTEPPEIA
jgi:aspartyl-tRNA(Asn)/glutamyl-tRNA(Gln) amidotransferase subunit A